MVESISTYKNDNKISNHDYVDSTISRNKKQEVMFLI